MINTAFEKFTEKRGSSFVSRVSIWKRGQIGFSQGAVRKLELISLEYVIMYYDKDSNRIGFSFTNNAEEEGAVKMRVRQNGASLGAKAFLDFYGIDYKENRQYGITQDEDTKLYVIDLNKPDK